MAEQSTPHTARVGKLEIQRRLDAEGVVLVLVGELDLASAPELARQVSEIEAMGPGRVLIDLRGLTFMDSTGLTLMIRADESAQANAHRLALRRGPNPVQRLFELTGVLDRFAFED